MLNYTKVDYFGLQTQLGLIIIPGGFDSHLPPPILYSWALHDFFEVSVVIYPLYFLVIQFH